MSCRARRASPLDGLLVEALRTSAPYLELVRSNRREDFDWLARSQGLAAETVEPLWQAMRTITGSAAPV